MVHVSVHSRRLVILDGATCAAFCIALLASAAASAADWPMWRCDAARTAVSMDDLPDELHLQWVRRLRPQQPAWKDEPALQFDAGYLPVVVGGRVLVGSTVNDRLTAYDLQSGRELWQFYTEGPIRTAPAACGDAVYVASDDGCLYCLDVKDGRLRWKFRGAAGDRRIVGNQRVISTWPCRGGPVVADGHVYFAAGVWPFMGTFVYAGDAESGRLVWHNDETSFTFRNLPHPGSTAFSGLSPQGHLTVAGDKLIVPGSRLTPAVFDRRSGKFLSYGEGTGPSATVSRIEEIASLRATPWFRTRSWLVATRGREIQLLDVSRHDAQPELIWKTKLEAEPWDLLAAEGRLLVVTREGAIRCFGAKEGKPIEYQVPLAEALKENAWTAMAREIVRLSRTEGGYCLVWGLKDGGLVEALLGQSKLHVVAVDRNPGKVDRLRRRVDKAGAYGTRACAIVADPMDVRFAPYLAGLITSEDPKAAGMGRRSAFIEKLFHPLRPYGGTACLALSSGDHDRLQKALSEADPPGVRLLRSGGYSVLRRDGPLPGSAPWLGQNADAGNTRCSRDDLVRAPLGVLWFGNALSNDLILPRHGEGPVEQVVGGRLFIEGADGLSATDVYTGRMLWTRRFPGLGRLYSSVKHQPGAHSIGSNFFATADAVYVAVGKSCHVLDPASGQTRQELGLPGGSKWQFLLMYEDLLIAGADPVIDPEQLPDRVYSPTSSRRLVVMERNSGKVLWSRKAQRSFRHYGIGAGRGKLFCVDRTSVEELKRLARRGQSPQETPRLFALDVRTGNAVWQTDRHVAEKLSYSEEHDVLVSHAAFRGEDGSVLWHHADKEEYLWFGKWGMMICGDTIYPQVRRSLDLLTGRQRTWRDASGRLREWKYLRSHGCGPMAGSRHLITFRSGCAGFFDVRHDGGTGNLGGFRSGCTSNLIAADGVLSAPDYTRTCSCAYQNRSSLALVHMPKAEYWTYGAIPTPGRIGWNFGAPGDRRAEDGTLWIAIPNVPDRMIRDGSFAWGRDQSVDPDYVPRSLIETDPKPPETFYLHSSRLSGGDGLPWVAASGMLGVRSLHLPLAGIDPAETMTVRLYFTEPEHELPGRRVFDVLLDGRPAIENLDVFQESGGKRRALVRELTGVTHSGRKADGLPGVEIALRARRGTPLLCGVEVFQQTELQQ